MDHLHNLILRTRWARPLVQVAEQEEQRGALLGCPPPGSFLVALGQLRRGAPPPTGDACRPAASLCRCRSLPFPCPPHRSLPGCCRSPPRGPGDVPLPSSEFTSASLGARVKAKQWAQWSAPVGPALLITKTKTSCCPRDLGEDHGSRGLGKKEEGATERAESPCLASVLTAFLELNIAPMGGRAGEAPWKASACARCSWCRKPNVLYAEENGAGLTPRARNTES